jgi:hypothetical protein
VQALAAIFVYVLSGVLQLVFHPFQTENLNNVELFSILTMLSTLYAGLYYMTRLETSYVFRSILFVFIVLLNVLFAAIWLKNFLKAKVV